jgi:hypothetical protein
MIVNSVHKKINGITRDVQRYEKLPMAEQADWARGQTVTTQTSFFKDGLLYGSFNNSNILCSFCGCNIVE